MAAEAAVALRALPGVGPTRFRALVDRFGGAEEALSASEADFAAIAGGRAAAQRTSGQHIRLARSIVRRCATLGIRMIAYGSAGYPPRLGDLSAPPSVLYTIGRADLLLEPCVAIVGSRRATAYGRRIAEQLGECLARESRCVLSGMAMGIDAASHRGALPGATVAILGSGVDVVSPPRNQRLYREILAHGAVASEYAPGVRAEPHHFPTRNRIIAALASDVVVVEASLRSGALITAGIALDLGREVHAVPGPIDRPTSAGTNRLIADGAGVVVDTGLLDLLPSAFPAIEDPSLRDLLEAIPAAPVTVEEVALQTDRPVEDVANSLFILEIRGYLTPTRDGRIMRTPGRRALAVRG